jgi:SAM-dependent methyltransferase
MSAAGPCPACGDARSSFAFRVADYDHRRCAACRSVFVRPAPSDEELARVYGAQDYYAGAERHEARIRREAAARAKRLVKLGARRVLDVGCAAGFFLDAARDAGLSVVGVEPGPSGAGARARGHTVVDGTLDAASELGTFDAVTLWEVIEHVVDPLALISQAMQHLSVHGILALSTPSMSGVPALLLGRRFPMITPPEHLSLFTRGGLQTLLGRAGLRPFRLTSFSNLGVEEVGSGLRRFALGESPMATRMSRILARPGVGAAWLLDRAGVGSELEVHARRV